MDARLLEVRKDDGSSYRALQIGSDLYRKEGDGGNALGRWHLYGGITPAEEAKITYANDHSLDEAIPIAERNPDPKPGDGIFVRPVDSPRARELKEEAANALRLSGIVVSTTPVTIRQNPHKSDISDLLTS
ncbi:MAG: hypothetical protein AABX70_03610 [Nanoarchaeota archaeon]